MNQVRGYDITIKKLPNVGHKDIINALKEWATHWEFQLERGEAKEGKGEAKEDGYLHWQVRLSLIKKRRKNEIIARLKDTVLKGHTSVTSTNAFTGGFEYCLKADTRVEGPWTDQEHSDKPRVLVGLNLYPWQQIVATNCKTECNDDRKINIIYDPMTNIGKTTLKKYLRWNKLATVVPPFTKFEDMAAMVLSKGAQNAYILDVPKKLNAKDMEGFWKGIECLKDGYAFDKRYKFRDEQFDSPHIWVLTNSMPVITDMAPDRWNIWMVDWNNKLVKWTQAREANIIAAVTEDRAEAQALKIAHAPPDVEEADQPRVKKPRIESKAAPAAPAPAVYEEPQYEEKQDCDEDSQELSRQECREAQRAWENEQSLPRQRSLSLPQTPYLAWPHPSPP